MVSDVKEKALIRKKKRMSKYIIFFCKYDTIKEKEKKNGNTKHSGRNQ